MNKKLNKKIILALITVILLITPLVFARNIGEFAEFRITRNGEKTGYLRKTGEDESEYVLNLKPSRDLAPIKVKHFLVNSNDRRRSDIHRLTCGERWQFSNWASKGYTYSLKMSRENWWDGAISITGSWSPDTK